MARVLCAAWPLGVREEHGERDDAYLVTPPPVAGQYGPAWLRWVDHSAHTHASAVKMISAHAFPPLVLEQIAEEEGDIVTDTNIHLVATLLRCIGFAHGLRPVPITLEDAITMPQTLVLDKALALPRNARVPDMI